MPKRARPEVSEAEGTEARSPRREGQRAERGGSVHEALADRSTAPANRPVSRRALLRGAVAAATVAAVPTPAAAQGAAEPDYGDWFEDVSNYDGTVDETGRERVTIAVGAEGNEGAFAFEPAAVRVDPGTTVVWEWSGEGGAHNVAADDGSFESETTDEAGFTFERTLDEEGVVKYACVPHEAMGMKGALVVGEAQAGGPATLDLEDALAVGGGLGLVGALLAMFALGAHCGVRRSTGRSNR
ncbi:halocyanin domain-containing protein [Halomarina halobia]|uniref:Halocyanin domain-containing protein n=1 Tax=Halomarina halobia TaxID=3033386 RepID=A0ABD6ADQ9_9EURY|nr:halocyanin domain-containing protein [Halomarina sp. PSR21]